MPKPNQQEKVTSSQDNATLKVCQKNKREGMRGEKDTDVLVALKRKHLQESNFKFIGLVVKANSSYPVCGQ